jgi:serine/threonine-protein kinase HipA
MNDASRAETLELWLYGERVAELTRAAAGRLRLTATPEALERWGVNSPILSESLRLQRAPYAPALTRNVLDGALPEGENRRAMARQAGLSSVDTWGMLSAYGMDVAGALQFVPRGSEPPRVGAVPPVLSSAEIRTLLERESDLLGNLPEAHGWSLAGVQRKLLLVDESGRWRRPAVGEPSTHILKPANPDARFADQLELERWAMTLANAVGLSSVEIRLEDFDGLPALAVARYDRVAGARLHQEDLVQGLGLPPTSKYQFEGGPRFSDLARLSRLNGIDLAKVLRIAVFTVIVGNLDAHGKNFSFLHAPDGRVTLAPLYDVSTHVHYRGDERMAMSIAAESRLSQVTRFDILSEARSWGMPIGHVEIELDDFLAAMDVALRVQPAPNVDRGSDIVAGFTERLSRLS